jgi:hypothetical protein
VGQGRRVVGLEALSGKASSLLIEALATLFHRERSGIFDMTTVQQPMKLIISQVAKKCSINFMKQYFCNNPPSIKE